MNHYARLIHCLVARLKRRLFPVSRSALILPSATPGSLGDDAMMTSSINMLRQKGFSKIGVFDLDRDCPFSFSRKPDETLDISGFSLEWKYPEAYGFFNKLRDYDYFLVIGADVLDGHYSDHISYRHVMLAYWAEKSGLKTTLLGFSFNDNPGERALRALRRLGKNVRICARDPVSYERLTRHLGHPPIQTADIAFLLNPEEPVDGMLKRWIDKTKTQGAQLYGINAIMTSKFFTDKSLESENAYLNFYIALVQAIAAQQPEARFIFIPHDYRPNGIGEGPLLERLLGLLPAMLQDRVLLLKNPYNVAEIKWLAGQLDFIVSSRMHLAIAAIGQGTPVFCFEYQGKFQGLFELIGMPELLSSMDAALTDPQALIESVLQHIDRSASIRERLQQKTPELLSLAEKNFDFYVKA